MKYLEKTAIALFFVSAAKLGKKSEFYAYTAKKLTPYNSQVSVHPKPE